MEAIFTAPDIECDGCAASIRRALGNEAGVEDVVVGVEAKTVAVRFDEGQTSREAVAGLLADIGFPPQDS
jgi:copper chaperone CopZ